MVVAFKFLKTTIFTQFESIFSNINNFSSCFCVHLFKMHFSTNFHFKRHDKKVACIAAEDWLYNFKAVYYVSVVFGSFPFTSYTFTEEEFRLENHHLVKLAYF